MQGKVYRCTGGVTAPIDIWRSLNLQGDAWWFGWSETEMHLPQRLNGDLPNADWERLSLFNGEAELRLQGRGGKSVILLTETIEPQDEWKLCEKYAYSETNQHILLGDPPESAQSATSNLVNIAFPTIFNYGIPVMYSQSDRYQVVVRMVYYYDDMHRLRYVRSKELVLQFWEVK